MDAEDLARVGGNVAHVHKKNPHVKAVLFEVGSEGLRITGGDLFAALRDSAPVEQFTGPGRVSFGIPREGLDTVVSFARQGGKSAIALEFFQRDGLIMNVGASRESVPDGTDLTPAETWQGFAELFERYEDPSSVFMLDMGLTTRFRLVKSDKGERRADWMVRDPEEPILVKIGPTARGLMMPIKRERHAEAVGQEGLW